MAVLGDIEVRVASKTTGKAFDEYDKPKTVPPADGLSIEKFIRADTGLEFNVEILVKSSFKFYRASGIKISFDIDGDRVNKCEYHSRANFPVKQSKETLIIVDDVLHKNGTQYCRMKFNFGSVDISAFFERPRVALTYLLRRRRT